MASEHEMRPGWLLWATWAIGPCSYGLAFLCYVVFPEFCYGYSDPGPDPGLALVMIATHAVAGICTVALLGTRGAHWRAAEFWVLLIYWAGIAGWLVPVVWGVKDSRPIDPTFPWICTRISVVAVVLMPLLALARWLLARARGRVHRAG